MSKYLFYPGCAMETNARAYNESLMAIKDIIGLEIEEVHDWNCCGATEYVGLSLTPAYALIARNLALAAKQARNGNKVLMASCSACYLNLAKADHYMAERQALESRVNEALAAGELHYQPGTLEVRHLLDVIINDIGLDTIRSKVTRPLKGLRIAPYLGCMVPRPDYKGHWSDHEHPKELDWLLKALGAEVIDFPLKTHCCSGHMTQISPNTAFELIRRLISSAEQYQADLMVAVCPMCQMNIDVYQRETNHHFGTNYHMPILFFTQIMGVALGVDPKQLGFGREMVSAQAALARVGVEVPAPEVPVQPKRKKASGLPMPAVPGNQEEES
jgi:heterodisulfide reductase subunit B2